MGACWCLLRSLVGTYIYKLYIIYFLNSLLYRNSGIRIDQDTPSRSRVVSMCRFVDRDRLSHLNSRGDETHVNPPQKSHKIEKDDPSLHRYATKADDGCERPDLVSGDNDGDRLGSHVVANLIQRLPFQDAHKYEERDRVHNGAERDAIDKPFRECVAPIELQFLLQIFSDSPIFVACGLFLNISDRFLSFVSGKVAFEYLLPYIVRWRRNEGNSNKLEEFGEIKNKRFTVSVGFEELSEDIGCAGQSRSGQSGFHHRGRHIDMTRYQLQPLASVRSKTVE